MKLPTASVTTLLLALLAANPAHAQFKGCPDPTPETRDMLSRCADDNVCRAAVSLISGCTRLSIAINAFFSQKAPLDTDEYQSEQLGPSEIEQNRKNAERYKMDRILETAAAAEIRKEWRVNDPRLVGLLKTYCADPLDPLCLEYVGQARALGAKVKAFNANEGFVAIYGKLTAISPGMAAEIQKAIERAWEEREARKKIPSEGSKPDASHQEALERENSETKRKNLLLAEDEKRNQIQIAAQAKEAANAAAQRVANRAAAEERAKAAADKEEAAGIGAAAGQLINALGKYQKARQDAKQPAAAIRPPPGKGGSSGGCGGIGSTTCQ